ncbi:Uncharacterised protein [Mycobacteroides abscessus subsp. abscessus]|nr:Uncharacterised protein [Mycobacteroides abscessus subsp. abscessus]
MPTAPIAACTAVAAFSFGASTTLPSGRVILTPSVVAVVDVDEFGFCPLGAAELGVVPVFAAFDTCFSGVLAIVVASEPAWPTTPIRPCRPEDAPPASAPGSEATGGVEGGGVSWVMAAVWVSSSLRTRPTTARPWFRCSMAEPTSTVRPCGVASVGPSAVAVFTKDWTMPLRSFWPVSTWAAA